MNSTPVRGALLTTKNTVAATSVWQYRPLTCCFPKGSAPSFLLETNRRPYAAIIGRFFKAKAGICHEISEAVPDPSVQLGVKADER
jgi:hypothetical protein